MCLVAWPQTLFISYFMCDQSFCIGTPDNYASPPAKTSLHTTSETLQINATIPSEFRKIFTVYLPVQIVQVFPSKEVTVCMCKQKNPRRSRYLITQEAFWAIWSLRIRFWLPTVGVVGMVYLARHRSGLLPENFWHVQKIRVEIEKPSARETIGKWSGIDWVGAIYMY